MVIRKNIQAASTPVVAAPAGGAVIADRLRLDGAAQGKPAADRPAVLALIAGGVALVLVAMLTFKLYQHWDYLLPA